MTCPRDAPDVQFTSPIFHPNKDNATGSACLNLINEWPRKMVVHSHNAQISSVFYFCELDGDKSLQMELHDLQNKLFTGGVAFHAKPS
ncbi:unnamed protein product [Mesocestoides corti]|uniref:UBC core domain-containing protein n=1 Tax=Mesocestoides corti TaxID=53468 RepID=A0A0R3UCW2_MESCO|nr:unnamed protein product [Mesocestoides corti]